MNSILVILAAAVGLATGDKGYFAIVMAIPTMSFMADLCAHAEIAVQKRRTV